MQSQPERECSLRGEANDHHAADQRGTAAALERRSNTANRFDSIIEIMPEIDQCSNCFATRKQCLFVQVQICFINATEAISPNEPAVLLYTPAVCDLPVNHLLAVRRATQNNPLNGKHLGTKR